MNVNRRHWGAGGLAAVLLVFLWWKSEPEPELGAGWSSTISDQSTPGHEAHALDSIQRHLEEECAACPDLPKGHAEKRDSGDDWERQHDECLDLLQEAALEGNPIPDTSSWGGCEGRTPLHYAGTPEQVQALLDAGADPNVRDHFGITPLGKQISAAVSHGSKDSAEIIRALLEGGADPWIMDDQGRLPIDTAQRMNTGGFLSDVFSAALNARLKLSGMTREDIEKTPGMRETLERMENQPRYADDAISELVKGMARTIPPGLDQAALPDSVRDALGL